MPIDTQNMRLAFRLGRMLALLFCSATSTVNNYGRPSNGKCPERGINSGHGVRLCSRVAAGQVSRFGGPLPKQYLPLGSASLLRHAVAALASHTRIANVLVAIRPEDRAAFDRVVAGLRVVPAGRGRGYPSELGSLGLEALAAYRPERVLIHDGARPFPDPGWSRGSSTGRPGVAVTLLPLRDTIKRLKMGYPGNNRPFGLVAGADTPRLSLRRDPRCHRAAVGLALTDDAAVAEAAGMSGDG